MFGIGLPELMIIAVVALIFIGPKNLPGVIRSLGRGLVQVKRATNEVRETVQEEMNQIEREIDLKEVKEVATDLKQNFDGVKSSKNSLQLNLMSTDKQLEAVSKVLDENKKDQQIQHEKEQHNTCNNDSEKPKSSIKALTTSKDQGETPSAKTKKTSGSPSSRKTS